MKNRESFGVKTPESNGEKTRGWRKAVALGVAATTLVAGNLMMRRQEQSAVLNSEERAAACDAADITLRSTDGAAFTKKLANGESADEYLSARPGDGASQKVVDAAITQMPGGYVVVANADRLNVPAGTRIADAAKGIDLDAIECLNGIRASYAPKEVSMLAVPHQTIDASTQALVVVKRGDTVQGIIGRECPSDASNNSVDSSVDPHRLIPGDILAVHCESSDKSEVVVTPNEEVVRFVAKYGAYAQDVENKYGVPHNVTLAMAMLESGYGTKELATEAHNFFGLKANSEWHGATYMKTTKEHVSTADVKKYAVIGTPKPLGGGMVEIQVKDTFKKFPDDASGFDGFGDYLKNRLGGKAYGDAFAAQTADEFVNRLFDERGSKYATDVDYLSKVHTMIERINEAQGETVAQEAQKSGEKVPGDVYVMPSWSDLTPIERTQFRNAGAYQQVVETLSGLEVSKDGYNRFVTRIVDYSEERKASPYDSPHLFPTNVTFSEQPRIVLHDTAWPSSAWNNTCKDFLSSAYNTGTNTGTWGAANYYVDRKGDLCILANPMKNEVAWHAGQKYSRLAAGVETPALYQEDITKTQYEGLVYTAAWQYLQQGHHGPVTLSEMKHYVIGHGEITEIAKDGDHGDQPLPVADMVAYYATQLLNDLAKG